MTESSTSSSTTSVSGKSVTAAASDSAATEFDDANDASGFARALYTQLKSELHAFVEKSIGSAVDKSVLSVTDKQIANITIRRDASPPPKFDFKAHERQFTFNAAVAADLRVARRLIEKGKSSESVDVIDDILDRVKERQSHIKFADKSPAGWKAIEVVERARDAADGDSDTEKELLRAERQVLQQSAKSAKRFAAGDVSQRAAPYPQPGLGAKFYGKPPGAAGTRREQQSICFDCGEFGHYKKSCPQRTAGPSGGFPYLGGAGRSVIPRLFPNQY